MSLYEDVKHSTPALSPQLRNDPSPAKKKLKITSPDPESPFSAISNNNFVLSNHVYIT
jgi:hypothetical protein